MGFLRGGAVAELARNTCTHRRPLWVERRHSLRLSVQLAAARTGPCPVGRRARRPGGSGTTGRLEPSPGTARVHISSRTLFRLPPWLGWLVAGERRSFALPAVDKQAPLPQVTRPFSPEKMCSFVPVCRVSPGRWDDTPLSFYVCRKKAMQMYGTIGFSSRLSSFGVWFRKPPSSARSRCFSAGRRRCGKRAATSYRESAFVLFNSKAEVLRNVERRHSSHTRFWVILFKNKCFQ